MPFDPEGAAFGQAMIETIENQIRDDKPPETRETFDRLVSDGYSKAEAKRLMANVLVIEIYGMMKDKRDFDRETYVRHLKSLPELPY